MPKMTTPLPLAPLEMLAQPGSAQVPLYVVAFDKDGTCKSPATAEHITAELTKYSDVFLMSHGWNNDWNAALALYRSWITNLLQIRPATKAFTPVFVGVFWPSIVAPDDQGWAAELAGGEVAQDWETEVTGHLTEHLPADAAARAIALLRGGRLTKTAAAELAQLVSSYFSGPDSDLPSGSPTDPAAAITGEEVLRKWQIAQESSRTASEPVTQILIPDDDQPPTDGVAQVAGLELLNPVWILRLGSVLVMKDRAGRVGGRGVSDLLDAFLKSAPPTAELHLMGHSYGCKVVLSALARTDGGRSVDSILLMQPAISARCFAADADGDGHPGGYQPILNRCGTAIITTFSKNDFPLTKLFHLAARRKSDVGDVVIAGGATSKYAALGGFGPHLVDTITQVVEPSTAGYPKLGRGRIVAVRSDSIISGHGDVHSAATAQMLAGQIRA